VRIGFGLPQSGPVATTENLLAVARRAEELGFDSIWGFDRLLFPLEPRTPYPANPDGSYPDRFKCLLDPIGALTFLAAHTNRVALGTSVLDMPFHNPVILARQLTTLDIVSGGRTRFGLGLGWMDEEFQVVGRPMRGRGRLADEFIAVLKAVWTESPVEFHGDVYTVPPSLIEVKPVQKPHPPLYLAAFTPAGMRRAATVADGWHPLFFNPEQARASVAEFRRLTLAAGRDPKDVAVVAKADFEITGTALGNGRMMFHGSPEELRSDIEVCRELDIAEIVFDTSSSPQGSTAEGFLGSMEQIRELCA
jgi:probable F420-dependent oxidoreductase